MLGGDDGETAEAPEEDMRAQLAALQRQFSALQTPGRGAPKKCSRCGDKSHWVSECKAPDTRECFKCHQKGHIARNCKEADAKGGAQLPLNGRPRQ